MCRKRSLKQDVATQLSMTINKNKIIKFYIIMKSIVASLATRGRVSLSPRRRRRGRRTRLTRPVTFPASSWRAPSRPRASCATWSGDSETKL